MSRLPAAVLVAVLVALPADLRAQRAGGGTVLPADDPAPADLILTNGLVRTVDPAEPVAEAVAVRDGRILLVGSAREVEVHRGPSTRVVDLAGRTLIPGMIDAHGHLPGLGSALRSVDLVGSRSYDEVVERVRERARRARDDEWITGRGWDQNEWPVTRFPTHELLSEAVPDHPVVLTRVDGHALLANAEAMERAGVDADTPDPAGGRIVRDSRTGEPTGVFVDNAMRLVRRAVPDETPEQVRDGIRRAQSELNRVGLTSIHDAGVSAETVELYREMAGAGELTVRNYVMLREDLEGLEPFFRRGPTDDLDGSGMVAVRAIKVSVDGALGSRGAALLDRYADAPDEDGLVLVEPEWLERVAVAALENGFQLNVHAIGDRGNRLVLDIFERALERVPAADHRFRIEHAQILHRHDIVRFRDLGVIPSMQAIHQASDMSWVPQRIGWSRSQGAYAWRSLLDAGVIVPGGSDFPVEPPDPLLSFHAAVTRQDRSGFPAGGWFPEQRMTRDEALRHLTIWPAHASFQEDRVGSITPGKLADLVVLSRDPLTVPDDEILDTEVWMTVVGGEVVYEAGGGGR